MFHPFPCDFYILSLAVIAVGGFGHSVINDGQSRFSGPFQGILQSLFFQRGEGTQHPIGQIKFGIGLGTNADLDPGEALGAYFLDDGLDAVVTTGGAISPDTEAAGCQGNVVKHDDNPGRGDVEVGAELKHGPAGEVHVGLGLQEQDLFALVIGLTVKTLELGFVDFAAEAVCQNVNSTEAGVVAGFFIFTARITQANNQPCFIHVYFTNQSIKYFGTISTTYIVAQKKKVDNIFETDQ